MVLLAIFVAGTSCALSERIGCQTDTLISTFEEEKKMVLLPQYHPKTENMAILSIIMAILGPFSRFSPDDHLDVCFSD